MQRQCHQLKVSTQVIEGAAAKPCLRKLALQRCELELLRSHPKDERGSVREIRPGSRVVPNPSFSWVRPTVCSESPCCLWWSFSGPFWDPERGRSGGCRGRLFEVVGGCNAGNLMILRPKFRKRLWFLGVVH